MATGNTLIHSLKIILMSTGALFIAILISFSLPPLLSSAASAADFSALCSSLRGWLRPPYLYVIMNGIIITIAATSRLHQHHSHQAPTHPETTPYAPTIKPSPVDAIAVRADQFSPYGVAPVTETVGSHYGAVSVKDVEVEVEVVADREISRIVEEVMAPVSPPVVVVSKAELGGERVKSPVVERSSTRTATPPLQAPLARQRPVELFSERPLPSSRHRRPAKATPAEGGKSLRVAKPKKHDTLESTWKAITEGRHIPLTRHLKTKSKTWENQSRQINLLDDDDPLVKKSETFKDRTNYSLLEPPPPPTAAEAAAATYSSKLKKEPSLGQDELNRRVEAFIRKFNEDMRLQRQQSLQQFMEKINRAT